MSERPISRGRSLASPRVWIDDPNPVFRLGLACCLEGGGYEIVGMSSGLIPEPPPGAADVLVFDLGDPVDGLGRGRRVRRPDRLIGVAVAGPGPAPQTAELDSVVLRARGDARGDPGGGRLRRRDAARQPTSARGAANRSRTAMTRSWSSGSRRVCQPSTSSDQTRLVE